jgi:alpha-methylacyl-CoA racemase
VYDGTDACVAPIIPLDEAPQHPHLAARETFVERGGTVQPAPAPRFSRTEATLGRPPSNPGADTREALTAWGIGDVDGLIDSGAATQA